MVKSSVRRPTSRWRAAFRQSDAGQGLVEYALIIVLISIAAITAMQTMAGGVGGVFQDATSALSLGGSDDEGDNAFAGWARHVTGEGDFMCPPSVTNIYESGFDKCTEVFD